MRILLVAATPAEIQPVLDRCTDAGQLSARVTRHKYGHHDIDALITGVGMVPTAVWCTRALRELQPDFVVNAGVCGTFRAECSLGTVVHIVTDRLSELGAEDGSAFLSVAQLGLLGEDEAPFHGGRLENPAPHDSVAHLPTVHGITVNTVHGNEESIRQIVERWSPDVESMEGAAFMYACVVDGRPFAQIRAVSNRVERRNRDTWRLGDAIQNLAREVVQMIERL